MARCPGIKGRTPKKTAVKLSRGKESKRRMGCRFRLLASSGSG
jgi:hypothetical protein